MLAWLNRYKDKVIACLNSSSCLKTAFVSLVFAITLLAYRIDTNVVIMTSTDYLAFKLPEPPLNGLPPVGLSPVAISIPISKIEWKQDGILMHRESNENKQFVLVCGYCNISELAIKRVKKSEKKNEYSYKLEIKLHKFSNFKTGMRLEVSSRKSSKVSSKYDSLIKDSASAIISGSAAEMNEIFEYFKNLKLINFTTENEDMVTKTIVDHISQPIQIYRNGQGPDTYDKNQILHKLQKEYAGFRLDELVTDNNSSIKYKLHGDLESGINLAGIFPSSKNDIRLTLFDKLKLIIELVRK